MPWIIGRDWMEKSGMVIDICNMKQTRSRANMYAGQLGTYEVRATEKDKKAGMVGEWVDKN